MSELWSGDENYLSTLWNRGVENRSWRASLIHFGRLPASAHLSLRESVIITLSRTPRWTPVVSLWCSGMERCLKLVAWPSWTRTDLFSAKTLDVLSADALKTGSFFNKQSHEPHYKTDVMGQPLSGNLFRDSVLHQHPSLSVISPLNGRYQFYWISLAFPRVKIVQHVDTVRFEADLGESKGSCRSVTWLFFLKRSCFCMGLEQCSPTSRRHRPSHMIHYLTCHHKLPSWLF